MKFIIYNVTKFLIVACAAVLIFTSVSAFFPGVRSIVISFFADEKNYVDDAHDEPAPSLSAAANEVSVSVGTEVDIFAGVTALSSSGESLITQLTDDYAKTLEERSHVFVYEVAKNNTNTLVSEIDHTKKGKWMVVYVLTEGSESDLLRVSYLIE